MAKKNEEIIKDICWELECEKCNTTYEHCGQSFYDCCDDCTHSDKLMSFLYTIVEQIQEKNIELIDQRIEQLEAKLNSIPQTSKNSYTKVVIGNLKGRLEELKSLKAKISGQEH